MRARLLTALVALMATTLFAQMGDIVPGENLVAEGIPKIPASLAEVVGRYTEFRAASLQGWHPLRKEMLITTRFGDTAQVHRVKAPGGARTQLTFFPDRVTGASYDPRRGDSFLFIKDVGGGEWFQIYRADLATGAITLLTDGKSRHGSLRWSSAGDRIAFTSTRRTGRDTDVYVMDPKDAASVRMVMQVEGGGWSPLDWSPDDKTLLVAENVSANESYRWLVDVANGERKRVTPRGGPARVAYGGGQFTPDGKSLYVTTDRENEFHRLARLDLATAKHTYLTSHVSWDVDSFELSHDGKSVAFITNEDGADVLRVLDTATGKETPAPRVGVGVLNGLEWHRDGRTVGFAFASARTPADVYSLDVPTGKIERWTESETGGVDTKSFPEAELVRWKSFDGRTISGFLYKPPARFTGPRPVVVSIHGGPEGQARPSFLGRSNYFVNELGVAWLLPNVRGSSGYGKTFLEMDNGMRREDSVKDIGALLGWIPSRPDLDASRVMVTGGSYGGYMTLAVATHYSDRIRCALDVVGISNYVTFLEKTESYRRDLRRAEYGDERDPQMRAFFEKIAPVNNAAKIGKPLFVVQGRNDPRVPLFESEQMVATVRKNDVPVWYLMAKDEGHGFAKKKNQDFQFYATVAFIEKHLLK